MRIRTVFISLVTALLMCSCGGKEVLPQEARTTTYKVAVIMPQRIWTTEKPVVQQALQHLEKAQEGLEERIKLELEWIDEDIPHLEEEVRRVTHDSRYAAVIGPKYSSHARMVAKESLALRMPVVMPSVTSAEVQRIYSGSNKTDANIFFMSESDLSQCQALLTIISRQAGISYVHVLSRHLAIDTTGIAAQGWHHHVQTGKISQYALFRPELSSQHIHHVLHFVCRGNLLRCNILEHR